MRGLSLAVASRASSLVAVRTLLTAPCPLAADRGLGGMWSACSGACGPQHRLWAVWCAGSVALLHEGFPGPGTELVSPAFQGGFLTT